MKLGRVEIPSERAGDQAAEQDAERVEPPALQLPPLALDDAPGVEAEIDAAVAERPDRGHRQKALAAVVSRKVRAVGEREAEARDNPARRPARIAIGGLETAEERRRPVGAADDRLGQRKGERAAERADEERVAVEDRRRAGRAQDEGGDENEAHEQRAVNRAFDEAGSPMLPSRVKARRAAAKPVQR